jgi:hypothetical protein
VNDKELLEELLKERTPEEIARVMRKISVRRLSELLHTLLCSLDHEKDCDFYLAEVSTTEPQSRMEWFWRTDRLLKNANIADAEIELILTRLPSAVHAVTSSLPMLRFLGKILPLLEQITTAREVSPGVPQAVPSSCPAYPEGSASPSEL